MDPTDRISVKLHEDGDDNNPSASSPPAQCGHGQKHRLVARGVKKTLSKTSMLVNFLPTGTLLTFELILTSVSGDGSCSPVSTLMIHALCAASCFFFHFTDSFHGPDCALNYGLVTPRGLAVFKLGCKHNDAKKTALEC